MKLSLIMHLTLSLPLFASQAPQELWKSDEPSVAAPTPHPQIQPPPQTQDSSRLAPGARRQPSEGGNLPSAYLTRPPSRLEQTSAAVILPDKNLASKLKGLSAGQVLKARILHSVIAFPDERAPVLAEVTDGE